MLTLSRAFGGQLSNLRQSQIANVLCSLMSPRTTRRKIPKQWVIVQKQQKQKNQTHVEQKSVFKKQQLNVV